jgi:hypothetical protein
MKRYGRIKPIAIFLLVASCSFGTGNLQSRRSSDLETRRIRRVAVVPPSMLGGQTGSTIPLGSPSGPASAERDSHEMLARTIYSVMAPMPHWQIISDSEVREVAQTLPQASELIRLRQIGQMVYADAVITGKMERFRERVGDEWGAKSPASVAFALELVDIRRGDVIWSARFDETQKSLSENIFALGEIRQRGVRWLSAEQLTQEGVKKAIGQLHEILAPGPTP